MLDSWGSRLVEEAARRANALQAAGIPECPWQAAYWTRELDNPRVTPSRLEVHDHELTCHICQTRKRFLEQQFGRSMFQRVDEALVAAARAWRGSPDDIIPGPAKAAAAFALGLSGSIVFLASLPRSSFAKTAAVLLGLLGAGILTAGTYQSAPRVWLTSAGGRWAARTIAAIIGASYFALSLWVARPLWSAPPHTGSIGWLGALTLGVFAGIAIGTAWPLLRAWLNPYGGV